MKWNTRCLAVTYLFATVSIIFGPPVVFFHQSDCGEFFHFHSPCSWLFSVHGWAHGFNIGRHQHVQTVKKNELHLTKAAKQNTYEKSVFTAIAHSTSWLSAQRRTATSAMAAFMLQICISKSLATPHYCLAVWKFIDSFPNVVKEVPSHFYLFHSSAC